MSVLLFSLLLTPIAPAPALGAQNTQSAWPGFRGPAVTGTVAASELERGVELSLQIAWKRPIGSGYSGVSVSPDLAVTMFATGDEDVMAGFDPATGEELWRVPVGPSYPALDGSFEGPISTPLLVGDLVIGLSAWGRLLAVDRLAGEPVWSIELTEEVGAVKPDYGFGTSPLIEAGVLVVQVGAPDGNLAGFDPATGELLWKAGTDPMGSQSPVPMVIDGKRQVLAAGWTEIFGVDPATGVTLWSTPHGGDGFLGAGSLVPVQGADGTVFLANRDQSSTLVGIEPGGGGVTPLWETRTIRNSYAVPVIHEGYVYGFSSRFLTAVDLNTGEAAWKSRPPGDGFPILAGDHLIILTKDGSLHLVEASPEEYREKAGIEVFDDLSWVHPSFALGSVFVRSTGELARVDIVHSARRGDSVAYTRGLPPEDSDFATFLAALDSAADKDAAIDEFLAGKEFPLLEGDDLAHFVYRGAGTDLAIAGDMIGSRQEARMHRAEGTDLFYYSLQLDPQVRLKYRFVRDYEDIVDPRNPRRLVSDMHAADMAIAGPGEGSEMSWMAMPGWREPEFLREPAPGVERGQLVEENIDSAALDGMQALRIYLPAGYDASDSPYPTVYYHGGSSALEYGRVVESLDNLIAGGMPPLIAVFIDFIPLTGDLFPPYARFVGEEVVPFVDESFRTIPERSGRTAVGNGGETFPALFATFGHADLFSGIAVQSVVLLDFMREQIEQRVPDPEQTPMRIYVEWGSYDVHNPQENWDVREYARSFSSYLRDLGFTVLGGEVIDSTGWDSWRNRTDVVLRALLDG